jgi:DNA-binding NarL/FixJ family response regulator
MQADVLHPIVRIMRETGRLPEAGRYLATWAEILLADGGFRLDLANILEEARLLCEATGRQEEAVTLLSAHCTLNAAVGVAWSTTGDGEDEALLQAAREALGEQRLRAAQDRGAAMTLTTAMAYAVMVTSPGSPGPEIAADPAESQELSDREREIVAQVAQGNTDVQIAQKLFISVATVRSHLDRIKGKTGYRRRADLTRLALREGIV